MLRTITLWGIAGVTLLASSCNLFLEKTPVQSVSWQQDGNGFLQYKTNDVRSLGALVTYVDPAANQPSPTVYPGPPVTIRVNKVGGDLYAPYGVVFGYQDAGNFYRFLILGETGEYRVDKKVNGTYSQITDWTLDGSVSSKLWGLNRVHTLSIRQTSASYYSITLDGAAFQLTGFADSSLPTSGGAGFYAFIGDSMGENFPFDPFDVRYQMTAPVAIP